MGIIDSVITAALVIAVILGFIFGYSKGKIKSLCNMLGSLAGYYIGVPIARMLMDTKLGAQYLTNAYANLLPDTSTFTASLSNDSSMATSQLSAGYSEIHIPRFFQGLFINRVTVSDSTIATAIGSSFAFLTLMAIFFLIFFVLFYSVSYAILKPHKDGISVFGENGKNLLGRIAGMVHYVFNFSVSILGILIVVVLVSNIMQKNGMTGLQDWLDQDLRLSDTTDFSIGRLFYNASCSFMKWISLGQ